MMFRKLVQFGARGLAVIVPAEIVKEWQWEKGDAVRLTATSTGFKVEFVPSGEEEDHG